MLTKFALKMADGAQVRNIDDLKAHFDINAIVDYFCDGKLLTWLEDRYYDEEADAIRELSRHDKQLKQKLCAIFEMESAEQIAWRRERLERLRQYTDDENILACVERVAFDQEDLAELLDAGVREIFCAPIDSSFPCACRTKLISASAMLSRSFAANRPSTSPRSTSHSRALLSTTTTKKFRRHCRRAKAPLRAQAPMPGRRRQ